MRKKILIGAGILLTIFIVFLIAICGASGGNKVVKKEVLEQTISDVVCQDKDDNSINYNISLLTNNKEFDAELLERNYTKAEFKTKKDFVTLGTSFRVVTSVDTTFEVSLMKNDECLKTDTVEVNKDSVGNINLVLEEGVEIKTTDKFYITFSNNSGTTFVFDTLLLFFDEV